MEDELPFLRNSSTSGWKIGWMLAPQAPHRSGSHSLLAAKHGQRLDRQSPALQLHP